MRYTEHNKKFTEKEIMVTWFFMTGMTMKQIAEWTNIPEKSVSYFKRKVMRKVGVDNDNEFIMWFLENRQTYRNDNEELSIMQSSQQVNSNLSN
ncbi:helix-turn-helix transcriptional regulator [Pantoea stewartii]|uniref:HTH luxR-type domain-containing protein n=1 Tax=Pantoea stewartii TaxID=66269 RepID=A0AB34VH52_9GAMM|nr:LuxR C-terminal-related transcriptional regulator [Pantoea stewartii]KTS72220.1 hypothetical protein RSA30_15455 [Pantoea stewartii]KTS97648.1 hypothetical protein RSA13_11155 [Pantoea stewartii]KTT04914.1 hypothetical protein RSA36_21725 [Pantoea stewartii]